MNIGNIDTTQENAPGKTNLLLLCTSVIALVVMLSGCAATSSSVIATTGTTIGVELSQNQATQTPTAVLGYKRAELAYVPTNRSTATKSTTTTDSSGQTIVTEEGGTTTGRGARDSANVLMELQYKGIFTWGASSGIYQRLAVGDIAVAQPGASLMFSKDSKGEMNKDVAKYVAAAQLEITEENAQISSIVEYVTDGSDAINTSTLTALVNSAKTTNPAEITPTVSAALINTKSGSDLKAILFDPLDTAIYPLYKSLPADKQ